MLLTVSNHKMNAHSPDLYLVVLKLQHLPQLNSSLLTSFSALVLEHVVVNLGRLGRGMLSANMFAMDSARPSALGVIVGSGTQEDDVTILLGPQHILSSQLFQNGVNA